MMKLTSIAVNRPMPLPGITEKTICTALCMYMQAIDPSKPTSGLNPEDVERAHYLHFHFDSWEDLCAWLQSKKLGSPLTTVH